MKKRFSLKSQISQITHGHFLIIYVKAQEWSLFNVKRKMSANTIVFLQKLAVNLGFGEVWYCNRFSPR